ncbi:MAG: MFS transporter [Elusimicrobiaceae bacterium]|nr:MFS transporter [Elusimicrobiaceae bacterium]
MDNETKKELSLKESMGILFGSSKAFWLINMVNFGDGIAYFGILTLLTRFLGTRVGMPDALTGISVSAFTGLVTLFMFGGGFVSDRLGVRRAITLSLGALFTGRVLITCAPCDGHGFTAYLIAWSGLFFMAAGSGILQPALYAGVKEYTDERTATIGYSFLYAIMNLGIVAESFVSPFVRTGDKFLGNIVGLGWGIDGVFWICTAITGFMMLVHMTLFNAKTEATHRLVKDVPHTGPQLTWKQKLAELPFLDSRFMFFIFILLPVRTLFAHQFLTMPDYVFRAFPEAVSQKFEWINGLNPFIIVIFVPLIAALTRKANIITMMIIGTSISAVTTFLLVPGPNLNMLIAYVILFSLGEAVWSSRFLEYVADLAPAGKVGAYMGLAGIPWFLAKFTTGLYSGFMLERFVPPAGAQDTSTLWLIYGIIACLSPIGLILAKKWVEVAHIPKNS